MAHISTDAIALAEDLNPKFNLLDIGLPGVNDYEVAARLGREECCKDALIVAVSSHGQDEGRRTIGDLAHLEAMHMRIRAKRR